MNEVVSVLHNGDFVLFQHRQQDILQLRDTLSMFYESLQCDL
jgi:hypothetical protein